MYYFKSCVGKFSIRRTNDAYGLYLDSECLGVYPSAVAAADDVYTHTTGSYEWDSLDGIKDGPTDLYEWKHS